MSASGPTGITGIYSVREAANLWFGEPKVRWSDGALEQTFE
jgi:hypothetical protein